MQVLSIFVFVHFFVVFCFYLLLGAFLKAGINEFEISIKFCFFYTHIDIFQEKKFLGHKSTFCNLKMQMRKNSTFSNILQKIKSYFFANICHSPCDSYWNSKKSIKLKPPNPHPPSYTGSKAGQYACRFIFCLWLLRQTKTMRSPMEGREQIHRWALLLRPVLVTSLLLQGAKYIV